MTSEPTGYIHAYQVSVLHSHSWRNAANSAAYLLLHITPAMNILDLARLVPGGKVTGLECESGREVLERAASTAGEKGVDNVDLVTGDVGLFLSYLVPGVLADSCPAHASPFNDATFDITYAHQVLQHTKDPILALHEMSRVTKPSGYVAVRSTDSRGFTWYSESPGLSAWRTLYFKIMRNTGNIPRLRPPPARLGPRAGLPVHDDERTTGSMGTW